MLKIYYDIFGETCHNIFKSLIFSFLFFSFSFSSPFFLQKYTFFLKQSCYLLVSRCRRRFVRRFVPFAAPFATSFATSFVHRSCSVRASFAHRSRVVRSPSMHRPLAIRSPSAHCLLVVRAPFACHPLTIRSSCLQRDSNVVVPWPSSPSFMSKMAATLANADNRTQPTISYQFFFLFFNLSKIYVGT